MDGSPEKSAPSERRRRTSSFLRSAVGRARRVVRKVRSLFARDIELPGPRRLAYLNRLSRGRLSGGPGPVVSLTTYGPRTRMSFLAIESIARGSLTPSRTILWLDEPEAFHSLPRSLRRLQRRGLEVRLTENFGPHTKYFPFIEETAEFTGPLVTADDDTIYPRSWLERLVAENRKTPEHIVCYRARRVQIHGGAFTAYATWELSESAEPSYLNMFTAVSGIIHPVKILEALRERGRTFLDCTPSNDDVWIHNTAVRTGTRVRVIDGESRTFPLIDGTQDDALWFTNLSEGRNDAQIAATFSPQDLERLSADTLSG
ncbi:MAG TPA: hypothetical protein VEX42_09660 [Microbacterium sp.]|nr:hypothetical protein [Microbacterium sp.]